MIHTFVLQRLQYSDSQNRMIISEFPIKSVAKPWGFEFEFFDNSDISMWILVIGEEHKSGYLQSNDSTSFHMHSEKDAYVICLSGSIVIKDQFEEKVMTRGGISTMKKGTFHQISADLANSIAIEIEIPSNRNNILRMKDKYGRENEGYSWEKKKLSEMKNILSEIKLKDESYDITIDGQKLFPRCTINRALVYMVDDVFEAAEKCCNTKYIYYIIWIDKKIIVEDDKVLIRPGDPFKPKHIKEIQVNFDISGKYKGYIIQIEA